MADNTLIQVPYDNPAYQSLLRGEYTRVELEGRLEFNNRQREAWLNKADTAEPPFKDICLDQANIYAETITGIKDLLGA